ncbi:MAG: glycoside hydrolase family 32 protein [Steroidobacteraceae bacterium]|nr:glycoside hydrolase family 32 protein [Steroidobacteraceae bacterium]
MAVVLVAVALGGCDGGAGARPTGASTTGVASPPSATDAVAGGGDVAAAPGGTGAAAGGGSGTGSEARTTIAPRVRDDAALFAETFRPQFHFTPPYGWMNDPNGMVFSKGAFHLFYQFNPYATSFGNIGWGHAVGPDQVRWQPWPPALPAEPARQVFSGSIVIDERNTSGLCGSRAGANDPDCLVAVYTANRARPGQSAVQTQDLAVSTDGGRSWSQFDGNPVLDENRIDFRDPKVIWHGPTQRWIMLLALPIERQVAFYASGDLRSWRRIGEFGPTGATGGVWECPDLFSLPVDGDRNRWKWVLKVDLNPGHVAGGSGGQYFVGEFDGTRFVPDPSAEPVRWLDGGRDFYCASHWYFLPGALPDLTWIGWMNNWGYAGQVPTFPWRGTMTLPRKLALRSTPAGMRLAQQPVDALAGLRGAGRRYGPAQAAALTAAFAADHPAPDGLELRLRVRRAAVASGGDGVARAGLRLLAREGRRVAAVVTYDAARGELRFERNAEGNARVNDAFPGAQVMPVPLAGADQQLRIFVDRNAVEVFAGEGTAVMTHLVLPSGGLGGLEFFAEGAVEPLELEAWPLGSIWSADAPLAGSP